MTDDAWAGGQVTPRATCVLAPNPGPLTLEGTNTWVLREPGSAQAIVVDPGPDDLDHLTAVRDAVRDVGAAVVLTLLTHGHEDHAAGARTFAGLTGCAVRAADPRRVLGAEGLVDGEVIQLAGGLELAVVATPGHSGDSLSFQLPADSALLTGDTILGRGTALVAHPDGRLVDYLSSLRDLARLIDESPIAVVLPGHGPVVRDPSGTVAYYRRHRQDRLTQVRAAVARGADTVDDVLAIVYADVPRDLWPAAALSVAAQLEFLREES